MRSCLLLLPAIPATCDLASSRDGARRDLREGYPRYGLTRPRLEAMWQSQVTLRLVWGTLTVRQ